MPVSNKKLSTPRQTNVTPPPPESLPDPLDFHQRIREQARLGLPVLLEKLMQKVFQVNTQ